MVFTVVVVLRAVELVLRVDVDVAGLTVVAREVDVVVRSAGVVERLFEVIGATDVERVEVEVVRGAMVGDLLVDVVVFVVLRVGVEVVVVVVGRAGNVVELVVDLVVVDVVGRRVVGVVVVGVVG